MWLIRTKLDAPPPTQRLIPRQRLRRRLPTLLRSRVALVHAPAGFGKTCLLAEWRRCLAAQRVRVAWLSLDEDDSEPLQFLAYLTASFGAAGVDVGALGPSAERGFPDVPPASLISALDQCLRRTRGRTVVILDDYHRLHGRPIDRVVKAVIETLGARVTFVIAARERPGLIADDPRLGPTCTEVAADQLRFTSEETRRLLEQTNAPVADDDLQAILRGTDGWAMAITAVRDWLFRGWSATRVRETLAQPNADLERYVTGQILRDLSAEEHEFLLRMSLVDRFSTPLAECLCADLDVDRIVAALEAKDLVIAMRDGEQRWYRFHRLLSELAASRLARSRPYLVDELQRRAAEWFFAAGLHAEAVRHALATRDPRLLAAMFEQGGGWQLAVSGYVGLTRNALSLIPTEVLREYPRTQLARVLLVAKLGKIDEAGAELEEFHARHAAQADPQLRAEERLLQACVDRYADRPVDASELEAFVRVGDDLPSGHALLQGTHTNILTSLQYEHGELEASVETARISAASYRRASSMFEIFVYVHQGSSFIEMGRLREAVETLRQAWQLARDTTGPNTETEALAAAMLASALYARGEVEESERLLDAALPAIETGDSWFDLLAAAYGTAALLSAATDGRAGGLAVARRARATAKSRRLTRLDELADLIELRTIAMHGSAALPAAQDGLLARIRATATHSTTLRLRLRARIELGRWHLARGDAAAALSEAGAAAAQARTTNHRRLLLEAALVEASAAHSLGDTVAAQLALDTAIATAMHEGAVQAFLDAGPLLLPVLLADGAAAADSRAPRVRDRFLREVMDRLQARNSDARTRALSERELAVAGLLGQGMTNKAIARAMRVSDNTVKYHLKNIYAKLGVATRADAAMALGRSAAAQTPRPNA
jgi:LuxR family maltose regulon positive regulatory protein